MFSCGKSSDVSFPGDESIGGETVDKILSEAAKLKRKCKSLRTILLETETKRQEEKDFYDKSLALVKSDFETKLSNIQSQHYIEVHQMREYKAREAEELSNLLYSAQKEIALQGHLIMSLTEKLNASEIQNTPGDSKLFRLPSEVYADEAEVQRFAALAQESTERLVAVEMEKAALTAQLHQCREENVRLLDQVRLQPQHLPQQQQHAQRSPILGPSSPSLQKGSAGRSRAFIVGNNSVSQTDINKKSARSEGSEELLRALDEISELKATIRELVQSKQAVEESVRTVLEDNEALSRRLEQQQQVRGRHELQQSTKAEPA